MVRKKKSYFIMVRKDETDLLESAEAFGAAGIRRVTAVLLEVLDSGGGGGIVKP